MQKLLITLLMLSLTFSTSVRANTSTPLTQGQAAPFTGLLLDSEKAAEVHVQLLERDLYKELSDSQSTEITAFKQNDLLQTQKESILLDQNTKLANQLQEVDHVNNVERILIFTLGVAATILAGSLINTIAKKQ